MANTQTTGYYFAPPSHWPVVGSVALFFLALSAVLLFNGHGAGWIPIMGESVGGIAAGVARIHDACNAAGRDPSGLQVQAPVQMVMGDNGRPDLDASMATLAERKDADWVAFDGRVFAKWTLVALASGAGFMLTVAVGLVVWTQRRRAKR